jgi:PKD repeat protein
MKAWVRGTYLVLVLGIIGMACTPFTEENIDLGPLPGPPSFSMDFVQGDSNLVVVSDLSQGFFSRLWSSPGGFPDRSQKQSDTILFRKAGTYTITLFAASAGGAGTSSLSKQIVIANDAVTTCSDLIELLAGGCDAVSSKCWTFTRAAGAVTVGPTPGSGEWFRSQPEGLQADQYDDRFCFRFDGNRFQYLNNGRTIDPWNGYQAVVYNPPNDHTWTIIPGGGVNGETRILLTEGSFMGVWDAGNTYDIVSLTATELVVRSPFLNGGGWFELYFTSI